MFRRLNLIHYITELYKQKPMWIGIELGDNTYIKLLIGINQDGEHIVEYRAENDIEWCYAENIVVKYGEDVKVFDDNNNLIKDKEV